MASIEKLGVILFFLVIQQSIQQLEDLECTYKSNCNPNPATVAKIVCEHIYMAEDPACTCEDGGSACGNIDLAEKKYDDVTDIECSQWCTENHDSCAFWKYKDEVTVKTCYLMTRDECQSAETENQCPSDHSNGDPECRSDKVSDGKCAEGTEVPSEITCPGPITPNNNPNEYVQKWKCFYHQAQTDDEFKVDMYAQNAMPVNGFCLLSLNVIDSGSCKPMSPEFRFNCVIDVNNPTQGMWEAAAGVTDIDGILDADKKLQDVVCTAPKLEFTTLATQPGRDIICSQGGITEDPDVPSKSVILAENYCHMLCDEYDVLTFETSWNLGTDADTVKRGWIYRVSGGNPEPLESGDALDCWGKRF